MESPQVTGLFSLYGHAKGDKGQQRLKGRGSDLYLNSCSSPKMWHLARRVCGLPISDVEKEASGGFLLHVKAEVCDR